MKLAITGFFIVVIGCRGPNKEINNEYEITSDSMTITNDSLDIQNTLNKGLEEREKTIYVSYAAISCGCPQWFETRFEKVPYLDGVERFYLEPTGTSIVNANNLWDGKHLPLTLKVTGRFSKENQLPRTYDIKGEPEKARIFWYDKINVVSSPSDKVK